MSYCYFSTFILFHNGFFLPHFSPLLIRSSTCFCSYEMFKNCLILSVCYFYLHRFFVHFFFSLSKMHYTFHFKFCTLNKNNIFVIFFGDSISILTVEKWCYNEERVRKKPKRNNQVKEFGAMYKCLPRQYGKSMRCIRNLVLMIHFWNVILNYKEKCTGK